LCGQWCEEDHSTTLVVDSVQYEIDLCAKHAADYRKAITRYLDAARPKEAKRPVKASRKGKPAELDPAAVRAWAREHGVEIGTRGRLPRSVIDAYREIAS
jgi:hypothetical protein